MTIRYKTLRGILFHSVAASVTVAFAITFVWLISSSLRKPGLPPPDTIEWIPNPIVFGNYGRVFDLVPMWTFIQNSALVVAIAVPVSIIVSSWAGFAMAQANDRLRGWLVILTIMLLMVPASALWLPRAIIYGELGLIDTVWALTATAFMGANPLFILLFYWSFRRVPRELFETAQLDGAGPLGVWLMIGMPLVRPAIVTVGVLAFTLFWSDFLSPLLYIKSEDNYTMPVAVRTLQLLDRTNWPILMAASAMVTAPVVALFLLIQRYIWPEGFLSGFAER